MGGGMNDGNSDKGDHSTKGIKAANEVNIYNGTIYIKTYDDAIHGITGKAGENRIFELDFNETPFRELFESAQSFFINENNHPVMAERVRLLAQNFGYDINWCERAEADVKEIVICDNIFDIDDLSGEKIYIDINDCILRTEDDMLDVINYNYSKRSFSFANKPVFMQKIKELRAKME